jgi:hypothetical protein
VPGGAQLDDPRPGGVLGRRGLRAGPAGDEEVPGPAKIGVSPGSQPPCIGC